jgi:hypothetical protein
MTEEFSLFRASIPPGFGKIPARVFTYITQTAPTSTPPPRQKH